MGGLGGGGDGGSGGSGGSGGVEGGGGAGGGGVGCGGGMGGLGAGHLRWSIVSYITSVLGVRPISYIFIYREGKANVVVFSWLLSGGLSLVETVDLCQTFTY